MIELGGNIVLNGFRDLEPPELVVVKKIVGTYARKFADQLGEETRLQLRQQTQCNRFLQQRVG